MIGLRYATLVTDKHSIVVSTWFETEDSAYHYKMKVDGRTVSEGTLADPTDA